MSKVKYKKPKRSRPGKRIYRAKKSPYDANRKNKNSGAVKAGLGALGLAVLVFIGYSIGAPVHKYITEKKAAESEVIDVTIASETTSVSVTEIEEENENVYYSDITRIKAAAVSLSAMDDLDKMRTELDEIRKHGYNTAVFNLKDKGGDIYFNIKSPFASFAKGDNVKSSLFADELAEAAKEAGLYSIARINLLEDSYQYGDSGFGSYKTNDGDIWTDNDGNSYLSPYDENTLDFISDISIEAAKGGFDYIVISGVTFPEFTSRDYSLLGDGLAFGDRYTALVRAANTVSKNADVYNCAVILETSAESLSDGSAEAVKPEELRFKNLAVIYDKETPVSVMYKGMDVIPVYTDEAPDNAENYILYAAVGEKTESDSDSGGYDGDDYDGEDGYYDYDDENE